MSLLIKDLGWLTQWSLWTGSEDWKERSNGGMPPASEQRVDHGRMAENTGSGQSSEKSPSLSTVTCLATLPTIFFGSKNLWKRKLVWEWMQNNLTTTNNMRLKKISIEIISRSSILGKRENHFTSWTDMVDSLQRRQLRWNGDFFRYSHLPWNTNKAWKSKILNTSKYFTCKNYV